MSFLSRMFGRRTVESHADLVSDGEVTGRLDYKGFVILAVPFKQNGQFQTAGRIEKAIGGEMRRYRFVRADRSTMIDELTELALAKGRLIIDEQGDAIFDEPGR